MNKLILEAEITVTVQGKYGKKAEYENKMFVADAVKHRETPEVLQEQNNVM